MDTALFIALKYLGKSNRQTANIYNGMGGVYGDKSEYDKALEYYQKGVASCLKNFNNTINVSAVPEIKDYLDWDWLLQNL